MTLFLQELPEGSVLYATNARRPNYTFKVYQSPTGHAIIERYWKEGLLLQEAQSSGHSFKVGDLEARWESPDLSAAQWVEVQIRGDRAAPSHNTLCWEIV